MLITDLRSDTVTHPTPAMLQAMLEAPVGDDVFGEDPSVNALEQKAAQMLGKEAAIFCPSGTMANQIAIKIHTQPLNEVICHELCHIYQYEVAGYAFNSGVGLKMVKGNRGKIQANDIPLLINPDFDWLPHTALVCIENTCNKAGGSYYTLAEMQALYSTCQKNNLPLHVDGARIFNAIIAQKISAELVGKHCDTISVCLSKGLGAPVGSLLIGSNSLIKQARKVRKALGGGMRQAGILAAAGMYALNNHIQRLQIDHLHAQALYQTLEKLPYIKSIEPADTNIIIFELDTQKIETQQFLNYLAENNIKATAFSPTHIRFVTHLDFTPQMLEDTCLALKNLNKKPKQKPPVADTPPPQTAFFIPNFFGRYTDFYKTETQKQHLAQAKTLFEEKKYTESHLHFFEYLKDPNQNNVTWELDENNNLNFEIIQGSKKIIGNVSKQYTICESPIATFEKPEAAPFRTLMDLNNRLLYSHFCINNNTIYLKANLYFDDTPPKKLYTALKELAIYADKHDDLLINKFNSLTLVNNAPITQISTKQKETQLDFLIQTIEQTLEQITKWDLHKDTNLHIYNILNCAHKLDYFLTPEGTLTEDLERINNLVFEEKNTKKIQQAIQILKSIKDKPTKELTKLLYKSTATFGILPVVQTAELLKFIQQELNNYTYYKNEKMEDIAQLILEHIASNCLFSFELPKPIFETLSLTLQLLNADYCHKINYKPIKHLLKKNTTNDQLIPNSIGIKNALLYIENQNKHDFPHFSFNLNNINLENLHNCIYSIYAQLIQQNYTTQL